MRTDPFLLKCIRGGKRAFLPVNCETRNPIRLSCAPRKNYRERPNLKTRKLKLEFYDNDGVRHSLTVEGPVTREKIGKLLDLVEVMSGTPRLESLAVGSSPHKYDRLAGHVVTRLKGRRFSATEARKSYQETYGESITLSTVSTYLTRLSDKGVIERSREGPFVRYAVRTEGEPRQLLSQALPLRPSAQPPEPAY